MHREIGAVLEMHKIMRYGIQIAALSTTCARHASDDNDGKGGRQRGRRAERGRDRQAQRQTHRPTGRKVGKQTGTTMVGDTTTKSH